MTQFSIEDADEISSRGTKLAPGNRNLGHVITCNGSRATIAANSSSKGDSVAALWSVGRLISIKLDTTRVVALVYSMNAVDKNWHDGSTNVIHIDVELLGEIQQDENNVHSFSAGISKYPHLGALVHHIRRKDLEAIYASSDPTAIKIGTLAQDESIDATISISSMLDKHFAVVGTTGVGKSSTVSLLLTKAIEVDPSLRILVLDPHNEYSSAFKDKAAVIDTDTLDLPFWLFALEEFCEVIYRGRTPIGEEVDALRDLIGEAKRAFKGSGTGALTRKSSDKTNINADTPIPYRIADLLALLDERIGKLDGREEKPYLRALKVRILSAIQDERYRFMFSTNTINDTIIETVSKIFRIPGHGKPISVFQLAGIPSDVVNSVASVLCRMAFELALWSDGSFKLLVLCEEAHRYTPADQSLGFIPTRQAVSRIAKEGRKYGISLGVVTQRPGELDPTILSQCSTVFAMRLANDRDQEIIRSAISDSSSSTTSFLSSIGNGEAIAFGEAVSVPMRMKFTRINENYLPKPASSSRSNNNINTGQFDISSVIRKIRNNHEKDDDASILGNAMAPHTFQESPAPIQATPHSLMPEQPATPEIKQGSIYKTREQLNPEPSRYSEKSAIKPNIATPPLEPAMEPLKPIPTRSLLRRSFSKQ